MRHDRAFRHERGFTLTELMVVVVIVGILAAISAPTLSRDRRARDGTDFASAVANEMMRARMMGLADRVPVRVYLFEDRIEIRPYTGGGGSGLAITPPTTSQTPARIIPAKTKVRIWDVITNGAPAPPTARQLSSTTSRELNFGTLGGLCTSPCASMAPAPAAFVYIRNSNVEPSHPEYWYRLDVSPLTGNVTMRPGWGDTAVSDPNDDDD